MTGRGGGGRLTGRGGAGGGETVIVFKGSIRTGFIELTGVGSPTGPESESLADSSSEYEEDSDDDGTILEKVGGKALITPSGCR